MRSGVGNMEQTGSQGPGPRHRTTYGGPLGLQTSSTVKSQPESEIPDSPFCLPGLVQDRQPFGKLSIGPIGAGIVCIGNADWRAEKLGAQKAENPVSQAMVGVHTPSLVGGGGGDGNLKGSAPPDGLGAFQHLVSDPSSFS